MTGTRDGTAERPFASVADALAQAETAGVCGVDVLVDRGSYTGNLTITRNTRILGLLGKRPEIRGSVVNTGPYELRLDAVDLAPSGNGVFVDHPCATTFLEQVEIADAVGYGIRQSGGTLDARGVLVFRTQAEADYVTKGSGVYLSCGVRATLEEVRLDRNQSAGLQIAGERTSVTGTTLLVTRTGVHPFFEGTAAVYSRGVGAVQVRDGARLQGRSVSIDHNRAIGLHVGWNGQADLTFAWISRTEALETDSGSAQGGVNVVVKENGSVALRDSHVRHAALVGIQVLRENGAADLYGGRSSDVSYNPIGVNVQVPGFDVSRLASASFIDNDRTFDSSALPVPEAAGAVEGP